MIAALQIGQKLLPQYLREIDNLLLARLHLTHDPVEAHRLAAEVVVLASTAGRLPVQLEGLLIESQALYVQNQSTPALKVLAGQRRFPIADHGKGGDGDDRDGA